MKLMLSTLQLRVEAKVSFKERRMPLRKTFPRVKGYKFSSLLS